MRRYGQASTEFMRAVSAALLRPRPTRLMHCERSTQGEMLTAHRKPLPRFPLSIQRRQPRPLPPRTRQSSCCSGFKTDTQLSRILQRCLPSLRREGHFDAGLRDGPANEHWCRGRGDRCQDCTQVGIQGQGHS
jgi:hypothetical protein